MALKQATRFLNLKTPLGADALLLTSFAGDEGISQLFRFGLEMISDNAGIAGKDLLGKGVTFSMRLADDSQRYFHGIVSRFSAGDEDQNGRRAYFAEVVPWLWFLTRNSDSRIFQKMSAPDIIQQIFKDRGFSDFQAKLHGHHPKREYCVQHQETDFNFVSRLMEEEGIFYYFEHADGKHKLILGDKATAYATSQQKEVDYPTDFGSLAVEDHIRTWRHEYSFRTGKFAQTDYNFETPSTNLLTSANTVVSVPGNTKFEHFEYHPGAYGNKGDGQPLTDVRMEEEEAAHDVVAGTSIVRAMSPGAKFKIRQHRAASEKGKSFVLTSVSHQAHEMMGYETGGGAEFGYENSFTCIPDSVTFRPLRVTRKPKVEGVQTAVVVGPGGEEIYPDKYGRVKVQFHWDRYGKKDENSSCWIRVSQVHAGKSFGGIDIPRIGDEVIVAFPNGDPDQPIIVGRLYHAENMPPFGLPGAKTVSGMKTKTYKGSGYNELVMDDSPGAELIRVHGQFDMDSTIEHDLREHVLNCRSRDVTVDETIKIGANRTETVGANESLTVTSNRTESVGANETLSVGGSRSRSVGGSETVTVAMTRTHSVGINEMINVGAAREVTVGAAQTITVGAIQAITVGSSQIISVGGSQKVGVGGAESYTVGGARTKSVGGNEGITVGGGRTVSVSAADSLKVGTKLTVSAGDSISLTTGSASIVMKKDGTITIKGKDITIEGSGKINGKAGGKISLKGQQILQN
jgi:type VI secretion system secreted protein VgrG